MQYPKAVLDKNIKSVQKKIEACLAEAEKTCEESKWKCVYGSEAEPGKLRSDFFKKMVRYQLDLLLLLMFLARLWPPLLGSLIW